MALSQHPTDAGTVGVGTEQDFNIAQRFERLPLTRYQKGIFAIIATAWLFDSMTSPR